MVPGSRLSIHPAVSLSCPVFNYIRWVSVFFLLYCSEYLVCHLFLNDMSIGRVCRFMAATSYVSSLAALIFSQHQRTWCPDVHDVDYAEGVDAQKWPLLCPDTSGSRDTTMSELVKAPVNITSGATNRSGPLSPRDLCSNLTWVLSLWSLHILHVTMWLSFECIFFPHPRDAGWFVIWLL